MTIFSTLISMPKDSVNESLLHFIDSCPPYRGLYKNIKSIEFKINKHIFWLWFIQRFEP